MRDQNPALSGVKTVREGYELVDNIILIQNNLRHINYEISLGKPSLVRIAKESHQLLSRMMVEGLRGTASLAITSRPKSARNFLYKQGNDPWKVIHKEGVEGCRKAWRYSEPVPGVPQQSKGVQSRNLTTGSWASMTSWR